MIKYICSKEVICLTSYQKQVVYNLKALQLRTSIAYKSYVCKNFTLAFECEETTRARYQSKLKILTEASRLTNTFIVICRSFERHINPNYYF